MYCQIRFQDNRFQAFGELMVQRSERTTLLQVTRDLSQQSCHFFQELSHLLIPKVQIFNMTCSKSIQNERSHLEVVLKSWPSNVLSFTWIFHTHETVIEQVKFGSLKILPLTSKGHKRTFFLILSNFCGTRVLLHIILLHFTILLNSSCFRILISKI